MRRNTSATACGTMPGTSSVPIMVWVLPELVTPSAGRAGGRVGRAAGSKGRGMGGRGGAGGHAAQNCPGAFCGPPAFAVCRRANFAKFPLLQRLQGCLVRLCTPHPSAAAPDSHCGQARTGKDGAVDAVKGRLDDGGGHGLVDGAVVGVGLKDVVVNELDLHAHILQDAHHVAAALPHLAVAARALLVAAAGGWWGTGGWGGCGGGGGKAG